MYVCMWGYVVAAAGWCTHSMIDFSLGIGVRAHRGHISSVDDGGPRVCGLHNEQTQPADIQTTSADQLC